MQLLALPTDIQCYFTECLSSTEKMALRLTCKELNQNISFMQIRIEKMNVEIEKLLNGRMYILCRLRLAALCGLHEYTVATIWSWATLLEDVKIDSLPMLRQISKAINS